MDEPLPKIPSMPTYAPIALYNDKEGAPSRNILCDESKCQKVATDRFKALANFHVVCTTYYVYCIVYTLI